MVAQRTTDLEARSAADLQWPELLERIAMHASCDVAARRILHLVPLTNRDDAIDRMRVAGSALALRLTGSPLPVARVEDLEEALERLVRGALPGLTELDAARRLLRYAKTLREYARALADNHQQLASAIDSPERLQTLQHSLESALDDDGELSDGASTGLAKARREEHSTRQRLVSRLDQLKDKHHDVLRDQGYIVRDGRYALPVRSDAHYRVEGIVLGSSTSGATLYVEPAEITSLGNSLRLAQAEVERERVRVIAALGQEMLSYGEELLRAWQACVTASVQAAIASFAAEVKGVPIELDREPVLQLRQVRHPLLIGHTDVVANDIALNAGEALIISGPNAGGKTVALKCLGLVAWMARAGLPIPAAAESRVGWFSPVLSDVGDDQSLLLSLSSFSGHVERLRDILEAVIERNSYQGSEGIALVLVDEIAAGTDPEEGSALATALLEKLVQEGAAVAVTTHYERLKELATTEKRFRNASVGFDLERMAPTFELTLDIPGPSSALAIARRHGLPADVIDDAQSRLSQQSREREDAVRILQQEHKAIKQARFEAEEAALRQQELLAETERERKAARSKEQQRLAREAQSLMEGVRRARAELHEAEKQLRRSNIGRQDIDEARNRINAAGREVAIGSPLAELTRPPASASPTLTETALVPGLQVFLKKLGSTAEVLAAPKRGQLRVQAGAMKLTVSVDDVQPAGSAKARAKAPAPREHKPDLIVTSAPPLRTTDNTLDLRGERVDAALDRVEAFVDQMARRGEGAGFVLHGHGTGALRSAVRQHLAQSDFVRDSRPAEKDEGGEAFTVFFLPD